MFNFVLILMNQSKKIMLIIKYILKLYSKSKEQCAKLKWHAVTHNGIHCDLILCTLLICA